MRNMSIQIGKWGTRGLREYKKSSFRRLRLQVSTSLSCRIFETFGVGEVVCCALNLGRFNSKCT